MNRTDLRLSGAPTTKTATVTSGGTSTPEIDLEGLALVGIWVPNEFNGTLITLTAAPVSGGTFLAVQNGDGDSASFTITTAAQKYVPIDNLAILAGLRYVKLVCTTAQADTDTVFTLALRPL